MSFTYRAVLVLALLGVLSMLVSKLVSNQGNHITHLNDRLFYIYKATLEQSQNTQYERAYPHYVFRNTEGNPFNLSTEDIEQYKLIPRKFVDLNILLSEPTWIRNVAFVTGASANHFIESLLLIKSFQRYYPHNVLIYYDLGLAVAQAYEIKRLCNVDYKKFDFTKYPAHIRRLMIVSFKLLIIKELLNEDNRDGLFWLDASIRFTTNNLQVFRTKLRQSEGIVLGHPATHPAVINTHPALFKFINTDISQSKQMSNYGSGGIFVYNTKFVYDHILRFAYYCDLDVNCISPKGAQRKYRKPLCHRYDQSILNILMGNTYNFSTSVCGLRRSEMVYTISRGTNGNLSELRHKNDNNCKL